ncbi:MAG: SIS domain-containing protein [Thermotogaceae bacterium]|nr:SIS domain-containing protein [Thermotogaceae bacterium]
MTSYCKEVEKVLDDILKYESEKIREVARYISGAIENDGVVIAFGTGHSHIMVEEMFYRAGGLVPVYPVLVGALMLHEGAARSSILERTPQMGRTIADYVNSSENDVVFVFSNSGVNAVPVEFAMSMRERGHRVFAVTSFQHSKMVQPRNPEGKKLMEVVDIAIDNHVPYGDASVKIGNVKVAPLSTIAGAFIVNSIVVEVTKIFEEGGRIPPVFVSANVENGDLHNEGLIRSYSRRIPIL